MSSSDPVSVAYSLSSLSVLDIEGGDAGTILHNLTTNHVQALPDTGGVETFITDVRGKTLGHVIAFRTPSGFRLIGAPGQSSAIADHADRYTIREVAVPCIRDEDLGCLVVTLSDSASTALAWLHATDTIESPSEISSKLYQSITGTESGVEVAGYQVPWVPNAWVLLFAPESKPELTAKLQKAGMTVRSEEEFHVNRIRNQFPWYGVDVDASHLPQEASRLPESISFTKGCYLGQETVARLDALGQVQKQLVAWSISGAVPEPGQKLFSEDKAVGRLTSVAKQADGTVLAIGYARRSHFDAGSVATATLDDGTPITATVIG
ncbi:MAG: aminomethyltransferase [Planctomycetota bacterium]